MAVASDPEPDPNTSADDVRPQRTWARWAMMLPLRLTAYFAVWLIVQFVTIGPMFWIWYRAYYLQGSRAVVIFYLPLLWLCGFEDIGDAVNAWINWWIL